MPEREIAPTSEPGELASGSSRVGIEHAERIAWWLDDALRIPIINKRIGLDPLLGAVPWVGDTISALFSLYLIGNAVHYQLPKLVIVRMAGNVTFDYLLGLIPFVGDISDFFVKSNRWNMELLRRHAQAPKAPGIGDYLFVWGVIGALLIVLAGGVMLVFMLLQRLWP